MRVFVAFCCVFFPVIAWSAQIDIPGVNVSFSGLDNQQDISSALQVLVILTVLSLVPAILVVTTSFTRIIIVLAMLRHALGLQNSPPNTVLISLALFLTLFTMMPVYEQIQERAYTPLKEGKITSVQAAENALEPMRDFMIRHTREKDLAVMLEISGKPKPKNIDEVSLSSLIPAFLISELQVAFQIGFVIFLPFLLIDLLVASVLMSMGMIMVPPLTISLPIKVLMFVLIEGWSLVSQSLVGSFL
jgi:flagellar biosynthetic protein FliP